MFSEWTHFIVQHRECWKGIIKNKRKTPTHKHVSRGFSLN